MKSHGVAFQNCCVCADTIVEVGTVGLDSGYSRYGKR